MLHHKFFPRGEDITSFTVVSTGRQVTLSEFVCFLNNSSDTSAMLTIHECGDQSPPLDNDEIYSLPSVSTRIEYITAWISLFGGESHLGLFLLFWYIDRIT